MLSTKDLSLSLYERVHPFNTDTRCKTHIKIIHIPEDTRRALYIQLEWVFCLLWRANNLFEGKTYTRDV